MNREPGELASERPDHGVERNRSHDAVDDFDLVTPRRYEQPLEDDADPVMPADGATLNTKI